MRPAVRARQAESGMAMLITLLFLALLNLLAASSLYLGYSQQSIVRLRYHEAQALSMAESGVEQVLYWFENPGSFNVPGHFPGGYIDPPEDFFGRRLQDHTSFYDVAGKSQYQGVAERPDLHFQLPEDAALLNDPERGIFRSLQEGGGIAEILVFQPRSINTLCTVKITGMSGKIRRTIRVELSGDPVGVTPGTWWEG